MFNKYSTGNFRQAVVNSSTGDVVDEYHETRREVERIERIVPSTLGREMDQREQLRHMCNRMEVIEKEVNYRLHGELVPSGD